MFFWILIIDTIHFSPLDDDITLELEGTEDSTRVRGEVWIPRTTHTYDDSSLLDMSKCSTTDKVLSHTMCRYRTHDAHWYSLMLYRFTDSESVYDGTHHTHIVTRHSIESSCFEFDTSKYIPPSDYDDDFEFFIVYKMDDFFCEKCEKVRVDTISLHSLESFTRKFQEDTFRSMVFFHRNVEEVDKKL